MSEMQKKMGVTHFVSELKHVENYPDLEKLVHIIENSYRGLWLKISKESLSHIL